MDFRTQIELPVGLPPITHAGQILMMGSCFVQNIGNFLKRYLPSKKSILLVLEFVQKKIG